MNTKAIKETNFEEMGFKTMLETRDEQIAKDICGLHLSAFQDELEPEISHLASSIEHQRISHQALWTHLYDRPVPVSDAAMLGKGVGIALLTALFLLAFLTSAFGHTATFYLFGMGLFSSLVLGFTLTGMTTAIGHLAFEKILAHHKQLQAAAVASALVLSFWGLFQLAEARGEMVNKATAPESKQSFVDDAGSDEAPEEMQENKPSEQEKVRGALSSAIVKIMIAADLIVGILLGFLSLLRSNDDYTAWRKLKQVASSVGSLERNRNELLSTISTAKKRCMAGILRAKNIQRKNHVPYFRSSLPLLLVAVFLTASLQASAQTIEHHEGILLDVSGSIGKGGAQSQSFREYLFAVKKLLLTEPANSRVFVSVITTESFGSVKELLKGRTPGTQGIFTDDLDRARHQLAAGFESRSSSLSPVAAGTDIIGALWHMKTLLDSASGDSTQTSKTIWIISDMMNETPGLLMPALIPLGPKKMLEHAKASHLIVPMAGYRIHVVGASTAGLDPHSWNTIKEFWSLYFHDAGAEVVSYSVEAGVERE